MCIKWEFGYHFGLSRSHSVLLLYTYDEPFVGRDASMFRMTSPCACDAVQRLKCMSMSRITTSRRVPVSWVPVRWLKALAVEFSALDVDAVFAYCHTQVLHSKHGASLIATLASTSISWALDAEVVVLGLGAAILAARRTTRRRCCRRSSCATHRIVTCGVG